MYKPQKRIPTLLALFILIVGLGSAIYLTEQILSIITWADTDSVPKNISITNISDNSLTISWQTDQAVLGSVVYKEKGWFSETRLVLDARDEKTPNPHQIHYVILTDLKPESDYEITLISDKNESRQPVLASTGKLLGPPLAVSNPVYGKLIVDKIMDREILISGYFPDSQSISSLVKNDGSFIMPLSSLRNANLKNYYPLKNEDKITLNFTGHNKSTSVVSKLEFAQPLPTIKLGENYDFGESSQNNTGLFYANDYSLGKTLALVNAGFSIILPKPGSSIPSYRPQFKGTGIPGKKVYLTIKTGKIVNTGQAAVDTSGNWSYSPETDLPAGNTNTTITSYDQNDTPVAKSVSFMILKSGTSVLGDATPSASLRPSPSASPRVSPNPSINPSPTLIATPRISATPSAVTTPVSGNITPTLIISVLGIIFLVIGGAVMFTKF